MKKPCNVFISYCHYDKQWLDRLLIHLKPLCRDLIIDSWSDSKIKPGSKWKIEIQQAIAKCDTAVLLVSPDFLASDFIITNELPPLIEAAEKDGKLIISLIIAPSLFILRNELSQFQAINDPRNPIIGMEKFEQEITFLKVAETIYNRVSSIEEKEITITDDGYFKDNFLEYSQWINLIKLGSWIYDEKNQEIIGSGINSFLVSRTVFGRMPFEICASIKYSNFSQFDNRKDFINTGFIFGWEIEKNSPTYYNLLLTGSKVILERVGMKAIEFAGQALKPYEHLEEGFSFKLIENEIIKVKIVINQDKLFFYCNETFICYFKTPAFITGRVGVRAWRCQLNISEFRIRELN